MKELAVKIKNDFKEHAAFLEEDKGLYISVIPTAASTRNLQPLIDTISSFGLNYTGLPNLHVTVIYSSTSVKDLDALYKNSEIDPSNIYVANIDKFEYWAGHKNQGVLVLRLTCPQLTKIHMELREEGYKVNYKNYQAHMTFIDDLHAQGYSDKRAKQLARILNSQIVGISPRVELTGMKAESVN